MIQTTSTKIADFSLWAKMRKRRAAFSFSLELTARCNNDCRHCFVNLAANDRSARSGELTLQEISDIADQALAIGALWVHLSGGEPLLREDFSEIYLLLKRKGLLVSLFTNATLIRNEHIELLKKYPPTNIEVTVYGVTEETYERVTGRRGSFAAFMNGMNLLLESGIPVRLKAMAIRTNFRELPEIAKFCRAHTKDFFRFDPQLIFRTDGDERRNELIKYERLTPEEFVDLERADDERISYMLRNCDALIGTESVHGCNDHLFRCAVGNGTFTVSHDGKFLLCSSLRVPGMVYDLRQGTLAEAWNEFAPKVQNMRSHRPEFLESCRSCDLINLCMWCPAHAYLESGELDKPIEYFCQVAHARADAIQGGVNLKQTSMLKE